MHKDSRPIQERRHYLRLDTVFPVQFRLESLDGKRFLSGWIQGFTSDVSRGGLCLSVNSLNNDLVRLLQDKQVKLSIEIEMPFLRRPILAKASVAWISKAEDGLNKYLIGLSYDSINVEQNKKIMRHAWTRKLFIPVGLSIIILLGLAVGVNSFVNFKLIRGNKALVEQLVGVIQESKTAKEKIGFIAKERLSLQEKMQDLEARIQKADKERSVVQRKIQEEEEKVSQKAEELNNLILQLGTEKEALRQSLSAIKLVEDSAAEDLQRLDKKKTVLEKHNFDKMYQWLLLHQNPRTGLTMSFEGDNNLEKWAFIYDQSLIAQVYTYSSDFDRVHKILDFFAKKAERKDGQFYNAYYADDGAPAEYIIHSGPNIWLGIAIVQYTHKTQDRSYLRIAEEVAGAIIKLQNQDPQGGIRGGSGLEWYSTEHNLDAYAFFGMLYKLTTNQVYAQARDKVLNWLVEHTYDRADIPVARGKGDATIATDTYAWSIAAIGPAKLKEIGMDPDKVLEFAEQNCSTEVSYKRPGGQTVKIKGFDFAPQRHLVRGGVVSSEWTAQMVMSFKIMADYYRKKNMKAKADFYARKADEYLSGLGNMIVSSPSPSGQGEGCLPYATQDYVDTGHGWMTPKGKSTGSVSGTAYTLFAYYNYNPLELRD